MPDVEFTEESFQRTNNAPSKGLAAFLVHKRVVKDQRQANVLMLTAAIVLIVAAIVLFLHSVQSSGPLSQEERRQLEESTRPH